MRRKRFLLYTFLLSILGLSSFAETQASNEKCIRQGLRHLREASHPTKSFEEVISSFPKNERVVLRRMESKIKEQASILTSLGVRPEDLLAFELSLRDPKIPRDRTPTELETNLLELYRFYSHEDPALNDRSGTLAERLKAHYQTAPRESWSEWRRVSDVLEVSLKEKGAEGQRIFRELTITSSDRLIRDFANSSIGSQLRFTENGVGIFRPGRDPVPIRSLEEFNSVAIQRELLLYRPHTSETADLAAEAWKDYLLGQDARLSEHHFHILYMQKELMGAGISTRFVPSRGDRPAYLVVEPGRSSSVNPAVGAIRRLNANEVRIDPVSVEGHGAIAAFLPDENAVLIGESGFQSLLSGEFTRGTAHEFRHARFHEQLLQGKDHVFNGVLKDASTEGGYSGYMSLEELYTHPKDLEDLAAGSIESSALVAELEKFDAGVLTVANSGVGDAMAGIDRLLSGNLRNAGNQISVGTRGGMILVTIKIPGSQKSYEYFAVTKEAKDEVRRFQEASTPENARRILRPAKERLSRMHGIVTQVQAQTRGLKETLTASTSGEFNLRTFIGLLRGTSSETVTTAQVSQEVQRLLPGSENQELRRSLEESLQRGKVERKLLLRFYRELYRRAFTS